MKNKLFVILALFICLIFLGSSVDAQLTRKGGISGKPISEINSVAFNNTTGQGSGQTQSIDQQGSANQAGSTTINLPGKQKGKAGQAIGEIRPISQQGTAGQSPTASQAGPTVITFDDLNTGGLGTGGPIPVTNQYASQGATFNGPVAIDFSKGNAIPGFAHSGTNAIEQCYAAEFCTAPIEIKFSQGQARVKVWVGYDSTINQKTPVILRAFDASGQQIAQDSDNLNSYQGPIAIQIPLEVSTINPNNRLLTRSNIMRVTVGFLDSNRYTNGLAVDDVEFERVAGIIPENPPVSARA
ncbi:MAG: hypothetical protein ACE14P_13175 [Methanotrichaceae archaeon]